MATAAKKAGGGGDENKPKAVKETAPPKPAANAGAGADNGADDDEAAGAGEGGDDDDKLVISKADLQELMAGLEAKIRTQYVGDLTEEMREQLKADAKDIVREEITAGGKIRKLDPREESRKAKEEADAATIAVLVDNENVPDNFVSVKILRRMHIDKRHVAGMGGPDAAGSVKLYPDMSKPVHIPRKVAESLATGRNPAVEIIEG